MGRLGTTADEGVPVAGVTPGSPTLQLGGVQEAVIVVPPRLLRAVALLVPVVLVRVAKAATSGSVVLQVRGGFASGLSLATPYRVSIAVAVTVTEAPLFTMMEFPARPCPLIWR